MKIVKVYQDIILTGLSVTLSSVPCLMSKIIGLLGEEAKAQKLISVKCIKMREMHKTADFHSNLLVC